MTEITRFQRIDGCSVCKHAKQMDDDGLDPEPAGLFWCRRFNKTVNWKEGADCPEWACER
jgi:hypothetical protein